MKYTYFAIFPLVQPLIHNIMPITVETVSVNISHKGLATEYRKELGWVRSLD